MKDRLWETYIQRLSGKRRSPGQHQQRLAALKTWTSHSPCSAQFLRAFIRHVPPDRWMQWGPEARHSILLELMRIDDGQGQIVPWLAGVIEHEDRPRVLEAIGKWQLEKKMTGDMLWNAWEKQIQVQAASPVTGRIAWQTLTLPRTDEIRDDIPVESSGSNAIEREIRLAELVSRHLPDESSPEILSILARWKPSLSVPVSLRTRLLRQWEEKARNVISSGNNSGNVSPFELKSAVWQGLTTVASVCPEGDDTVTGMMETWLFLIARRPVLDCRSLSLMSTWRPGCGRLPDSLSLQWSRLLVVQDRLVWESIWRALGKSPGEPSGAPEDKPERDDPGLAPETWQNCLAALESTLKSNTGETFFWLSKVMQPSGLSLEQRQQWQKYWVENLSSTVSQTRGGALVHLLRFGDPSLPGYADLGRRLVETATSLLKSPFLHFFHHDDRLLSVLENEVSEALGTGDSEDGCFTTVSGEIWRHLLPCPVPGIEVKAFPLLVRRLSASGAEKKAEKDALELFSCWLSVLSRETDPSTLRQIGSLWHETSGLPETLHQPMLSFWKQHTTDPNPEIRAAVWEALLPLGDEIGEFLLSRLKDEMSPLVLCVMSRWRPSPELVSCPRFRSRFLESWGDVLSRLAGDSDDPDETILAVIGRNLLRLTVCDAHGRKSFRHVLEQLKPVLPFFQEEITNWQITLDFLDALETPPEIFVHQPGRLDKSSLHPGIIELFDLTSSAAWSGCSANFRENSFFVAATVLRTSIAHFNRDEHDRYRSFTERSLRLMGDLLHHEAIHAEADAGWEEALFLAGRDEIRHILAETASLDHLSDHPFHALLRLCHGLSTFVQKKAFCQVLDEIRQVSGHVLAPLADLALWREVCVAREMAGVHVCRECEHEIEGGIDPIPERRWLRGWIHTFGIFAELNAVTHPSERSSDGKNLCSYNLSPGFGSVLWETLEPELTLVAQKESRSVPPGFCPPGMESFFSVPPQTGQLTACRAVPASLSPPPADSGHCALVRE